MSCTLIFTAGAKGGSGKTTVARFLITYLREDGANPLLLDLDDENHTLTRFFPEALQIDLRHEFAHDVLIEKALSGDYQIMVADLRADAGHEVLEWFLDLPFEELQARGVQFCAGSVASVPESVQSFLNWVGELRGHVSYLIFKNLKDGEILPDYEDTREAIEFRKQLGACPCHHSRLDEEYQTELERLNLTISELIDSDQLQQNLSARGKPLGDILPQFWSGLVSATSNAGSIKQLDEASHLFLSAQEKKSKGIAHG